MAVPGSCARPGERTGTVAGDRVSRHDEIEVTRDEFFRALGGHGNKGLDIMPSIINSVWPYHSEWKCQKTGFRFGRSENQYCGGEQRYFLESGS